MSSVVRNDQMFGVVCIPTVDDQQKHAAWSRLTLGGINKMEIQIWFIIDDKVLSFHKREFNSPVFNARAVCGSFEMVPFDRVNALGHKLDGG